MRAYGLRYLYRHLGKALEQMPFEITDHNKTVAVVLSTEEYDDMKEICDEQEEQSRDEEGWAGSQSQEEKTPSYSQNHVDRGRRQVWQYGS